MDDGPVPLKVGEPVTPDVASVSPFLNPAKVAVNVGLESPYKRLLLSAVTDRCALLTVNEPLLEALSDANVVFVAVTVKDVAVTAGVVLAVVIVKVEVLELSPAANATGLGENNAVAPTGSAPIVRFALNAPVVIPRFTVIGKVTLPPVP